MAGAGDAPWAAPEGAPEWVSAYEALGVRADATEEEINQAFRAIARTCHPDKARPEMKATGNLYTLHSDIRRCRPVY